MAGGRGKTTEERVEAAMQEEEGGERGEREKKEKRSLWTDQKVAKEKWTKHSVLPVLAFLAFLPNSLSLSLSVFDIMLEIIYHLNNNASNYVKMPYNRYDSWEGNAWGRRMIFFVADDCWGSALTGLGWDGMGCDGMRYACECSSSAREELSSMAAAWGKTLQNTYKEVILNMSKADCKVSYRYKNILILHKLQNDLIALIHRRY